jgi:hypothetical protein
LTRKNFAAQRKDALWAITSPAIATNRVFSTFAFFRGVSAQAFCL